MDLMENIVTSWLYTKGYFVFNNLKVGVREVDILAIKLDDGKIIDKIHIEVQCSSNPIGYIGGSSSAKKRSEKEIERGVEEYINKKFYHKKTKHVVESLLGKKYEKWFICGILKNDSTVKYFEKKGVKVIRIKEIFSEVKKNEGKYNSAEFNRYHQLLYLSNL